MNKNVNRWIIYILSINILALGIILNTHTDLGVLRSLVFFMLLVRSTIFRTASIILYLILIIVQICLVRKLTITIF